MFCNSENRQDPKYLMKKDIMTVRTSNGCPQGNFGCIGKYCPKTCLCEEHCTYEKCLLYEKPDACLRDTNSAWLWDEWNMYWVAQMRIGNFEQPVNSS